MDVGERMRALVEADWIDQDRRFGGGKTAHGRPAPKTARPARVTTAQDAAGGCDGIKNGLWGFHVASGEKDPWWQVDLGKVHRIDRVVVYNRIDSGAAARAQHLRILAAGDDRKKFRQVYQHDGKPFGGVKGKPLTVRLGGRNVTARLVRLQVPGRCSFALDEVEVYAAGDPNKNVALNKPADQISVSPHSRPGTMQDSEYARYNLTPLGRGRSSAGGGSARGTARPASGGSGGGFSLAHTRAVVERGRKLAARLKGKADAERLSGLAAELDKLRQRLARMEGQETTDQKDRQALYTEVRRVVRRIAFCNPLLDLDKLLFIKRHDPGGPFHMCDQYYGCNARPGGGLFVLADPLGPRPKLINLLESSVVEKGRLKGRKLAGGSFLSPELSFDGRTILFAYSECGAKKTYTWGPTISYHIFRCNADGSGLVQLSDGPADDFDPCFLPNGRIVFVSLRRGGYLRCGRHCPVYAMFSMAPDGSDIIPISFHETHEWHPSVDHDGRIVYTRWDYVDRDTNVAHHIWTCYPDGRDPRSFHGNYPVRRQDRPWMEMSIRAIPGSSKYVATTGAHHGNAFGSLVLINPNLEDDNAISQLERLTPEVPFPEAEGRPIRNYMIYGTAWPLSEDDYLCVYDPAARNRGIYWIDRDGNRELLYRDPAISCLSPIPLRPRPRPPIIPDATTQTHRPRNPGKNRPATIAVMNVYDSDFEWPKGTEIAALRILQLLPKTTAPPNRPRIGVGNQTNARAVLGTVPVEADGSIHFEAPPGKAIYFQALDARGLAVQSMRTVTYVHPGERLTCQGCHEHKYDSARQPTRMGMAMLRAASKIQPDVDGSNPFNYPRLVQPVLDRNCVPCHTKAKHKGKAPDLSGGQSGKNGWTRSYVSLASKYGFYFHVHNGSIKTGVHGGSRTIPGQFGARASKLFQMLDKGHNKLKLSEEDLHRIALWLDCNCEFYGSYENTAAQARGEIVQPTLD